MRKLIIFFNEWFYRLKDQAKFKTEMSMILSKEQKKEPKIKVDITRKQATMLITLESYGLINPDILVLLIEKGLVKKSEENEAKRKYKRD